MSCIQDWDPFVDVTRVENALLREEKADIPPEIMTCFNLLVACELSDQWLNIINGEDELEEGILLETKDKLFEAGFRDENIALCVGSMVASMIANHVDFIDIIEINAKNNADKILTKCCMYLLSAYEGPPSIEEARFIISFATSDEYVHTLNIKRLLEQTLVGDGEARRELILSIVPLWRGLFERFSDDWHERLGFLFDQAKLLNDPSDLAVIGDIFYESGAHELAYSMVAKSALSGNKEAWGHLNNWLEANLETYEPNKMLQALIEVGQKGMKLPEH